MNDAGFLMSEVTDDDATVARLAAMPLLDYDRVRVAEATRLGCRAGTLDDLVQAYRDTGHDQTGGTDARPPEFTDESLALRFTATHRNRLRHVAAWGRWYVWDGKVWTPDNTMLAFDLARAICREASAECNDHSTATIVAAARTVAAVERLAKADRQHAATVDQWDTDPWLLNTPGGVVDLRTGKIRPHRVDDYMTRITAVAPGGGCPMWMAFLARPRCRTPSLKGSSSAWPDTP